MKGTFFEPTVYKYLYLNDPLPPSATLSERTKVDDRYVDGLEAISLYHIHCASLKRVMMSVFRRHVGVYTGTTPHVNGTSYRSPTGN